MRSGNGGREYCGGCCGRAAWVEGSSCVGGEKGERLRQFGSVEGNVVKGSEGVADILGKKRRWGVFQLKR